MFALRFEMQSSTPEKKNLELEVIDRGLSDFLTIWTEQKEIQQKNIKGEGQDSLIFCEHNPVITLGRSAKKENVLFSTKELQEKKVEIHEIERGGDVTWHGPGQIVLYPILDLRKKKKDVNWYMRSLEEVIIRTLNHFNISGGRSEGRTGVWTGITGNDNLPTDIGDKKIASIGVRISRWCTLHGCALNVADCSAGFSLINPCGFQNIQTTSIEQETGLLPDMNEVKDLLTYHFSKVFEYDVI